MDLKKILLEKVYDPGEAKKRVPAKLTKSQLLKLKHKIKKYKRYGDSLNNETDLLDLSNTLNYIARGAKRYVETLDDIDDLDETMLKYGLNYKILPSYTSLDIKIKTDVDYNQ